MQTKLLNKQYILIMLVNACSWMSYYIVTTILTSYMESLSIALSVAGVAGGIFAFTSMFTRPVTGIVTDTFNRKWIFVICITLMFASLFLYTVHPTAAFILVFRGLQGVAFGFQSTASMALVAESAPRGRTGEAISYYGIITVAGMALGPIAAIRISNTFGYPVCMWVGTIFLAAAAGIAFFFPYKNRSVTRMEREETAAVLKEAAELRKRNGAEPAPEPKSGALSVIRRFIEPGLLDLTMMHFPISMMNGIISAFLVIFGQSRGLMDISLYFTVNAVLVIVLRILFARKVDKLSIAQSYIPSYITAVAALVLIAFSDKLWMLILSAALRSVTQVLENTTSQTTMLKSVAPERQGAATCTYYIGGDGGQAIGPMIGGLIVSAAGYSTMWIVFAVIIAADMVWFLCSKWRKLAPGETYHF
ncbi:MAG: MFS transporter [Lachnospiraceae bacterium]|nr:MFS transporter [Lachnospiraceae bacterium]